MARGYNAFADIVKTTTDGVDLNQIWREFQETLSIVNTQRSGLASLFTYTTNAPAEEVAQTAGSEDDFEESSEFGVPKAIRNGCEIIKVGFPLRWFDAATRFTTAFLRDAPAAQVEAVHARALESDNRLVFKAVLRALLVQTTVATRAKNEDGTPIYALWDGAADSVPPKFEGNNHAAGHTHYLTSQSATIDGVDLRDLIRHVTHHGYGSPKGDQMLILVNPIEGETVQNLRVANGSPFDFIPSAGAPSYLTNEVLVGDRPPAEFNGLKVLGGFGEAWIVESYLVPQGYVISLASGGPGSPRNPLALREHPRPEFQGLRQIPGAADYPLMNSYYARGFGVGAANRGAAAVMQVTTNVAYTSPAI
ncbi:hypothetical protein D6T63_12155 [Arthrobacter cheniae]|uniref:Major capsid protein n=1 Tax=Arthrobacter cheniae TaxID=1258888 RepID=A0A3A5M1X2_9MICC|nr:hypothetical protein [Arthrobacter cheniae]RJT78278.1 hypothetical protein D6T63_12155 [Arthrobacter cheniae]